MTEIEALAAAINRLCDILEREIPERCPECVQIGNDCEVCHGTGWVE